MKKTILILLLLVSQFSFAKPKDDRYFELRVYYCNPGRLDALLDRFKNHTIRIFAKHGINDLGYWIPTNNTENALYYLMAYPSKAARDSSWKAFYEDPEWKEVARKSELDGKIIAKATITFLKATDFSPRIKSSKAGENPVFELRTYTSPAGKLPNILNRFRDYTLKIFKSHGMQNIAYFTTIEQDPAQQGKLVYFLAHKSEEAAKISWDNFRSDPKWIKARDASEVNGKIVDKVESVFMKTTEFSKLK